MINLVLLYLRTVKIIVFPYSIVQALDKDHWSKRCVAHYCMYIDVYAVQGTVRSLIASFFLVQLVYVIQEITNSLHTNCHNIWVWISGPIAIVIGAQNPWRLFRLRPRWLLVIVEFPASHMNVWCLMRSYESTTYIHIEDTDANHCAILCYTMFSGTMTLALGLKYKPLFEDTYIGPILTV